MSSAGTLIVADRHNRLARRLVERLPHALRCEESALFRRMSLSLESAGQGLSATLTVGANLLIDALKPEGPRG